MADKIETFIEMVGKIDETYDEEAWHCRLGFFGMGWDKGVKSCEKEVEKARILQFSPTGDNHHNAALCPHCGEPLRKAVELIRALVESGSAADQAEARTKALKFLKDFS